MILGIVGSESAKFTPETEAIAKRLIRSYISIHEADTICSGECHLGGIDIWAKEAAQELNLKYIGYPPAKLVWNGGYKQRNIQIAKKSDVVICITLRQLPESYNGIRFDYCYHCRTDKHVKSGGCWTVKFAKSLGKTTDIIVIP